MELITDTLKDNSDETYAVFMRKLLPSLEPASILGVRTPILRKIAKEVEHDPGTQLFLSELPHVYFEENQLHGFLISKTKDFQHCIEQIEAFLPYIDNWATCDQTSPTVFSRNKDALLPYLDEWLKSSQTYTVRFSIGMLMRHFLDSDFRPEFVERISLIRSDEYYINMEMAWYLATALAKQWDHVIPYLEEKRLQKWVHNKTIQKAIESYRIPDEKKAYLKKLKS